MELNPQKKILLITGAAGFIGFHLSKQILESSQNFHIIGFDNLDNYYDVSLKEDRLAKLNEKHSFTFIKGSIADKTIVNEVFTKYKPTIVVNLAAQAGVRYSITHPQVYIESNIIGFFNVLEACRNSYNNSASGVQHLVYASSSSIYGNNKKMPYSTDDKVDYPVSLYAATKKSNELMAHAYSSLYHIPTTGLRFFTVYGPWGRPDMAYFSFANKMVKGEKIQIYNYGDMYRDFTYIDDAITGIINVIQKTSKITREGVPYHIYNIGNNKPENLLFFVETLEKHLMAEGVITSPVEKEFLPMQSGDVYQTCADIDELIHDFGFSPHTSLDYGLAKFAKWYKTYYFSRIAS